MKLPANLESLNPYSSRFAQLLLTARPEWLALARADESPKATPGSLLLEIPCPVPTGTNDQLVISTDDEEVSFFFDRFHEHVGWGTDMKEEEEFSLALKRISGLLAEEWAVLVSMKGDKWRGSSWMDCSTDKEWLEFVTDPGDFDTCYARSWKGRCDRHWKR